MKSKDNKTIINITQILIILALAFAIAAQFTPFASFSSSDMQEKLGESTPITRDWGLDYYILGSRLYINDYILGEEALYYEKIFIFNFFIIENNDNYLVNYYVVNSDYSYSDAWSSQTYLPALLIVIGSVMLIASFYYGLLSLKQFGSKKTKTSLYAGILNLFIFIMGYVSVKALLIIGDRYNRGWADYIDYHQSFYYFLISAILFICVYFLQNNIIYKDEKKNKIVTYSKLK
jgi:hypothetical protein